MWCGCAAGACSNSGLLQEPHPIHSSGQPAALTAVTCSKLARTSHSDATSSLLPLLQLLRSLWLYLGLTQLPAEPAWRAAAGGVAAATPLLFVGPSPHRSVDGLERLRLELGDRLAAMAGSGGWWGVVVPAGELVLVHACSVVLLCTCSSASLLLPRNQLV